MAVFTQVSDDEVAQFLALYGLPAPDAVTGIAEGVENTNYKVLAGGQRYILTLYEARVDMGDLPYFLGLMEHAADVGLPAARPLRTHAGDRLATLAGRPAALIEFLPGRPDMNPSLDGCRKAGTCLAEFHEAMGSFSKTRENSMGFDTWRALAAQGGSRLDQFGDGVASEISRLIDDLVAHWPEDLPQGSIHADFFPDNLLLDHGEVSGIIDFYFACTDDLAYDLAMGMNAYTREDGAFDGAPAEAFLRGYEDHRALTAGEKEALPIFLTASALRIFLTRAVDLLEMPDNALYTPKNPLPWLRLIRHHRARCEDFL